ncbi:PCI-domain-containing protein [Clavulina sp. PMI_390]|nr:PCI-domain-containing protein [Clavulina sp. PMI_390]
MSLEPFDYESMADTAAHQTRPPRAAPKRRNVVIDDQHPFDLDAYINQYEGRAKIKRLRFIAEESEQLAPQALQLAVQLLKQTRDIALYQATVQEYNSRPNTTAPISLDTAWVDNTGKANLKEKDKLETELKTYMSNMIKESIRMGHRDLGEFFWRIGDYQQALKHYNKSREFCSTNPQVLEYALTAIRLLLEFNDYTHISTYVYKAEATLAGASTGETSKDAKKAPIPAAGSAAAAAAAASAGNTDKDKAMAKLELANAIAYLGTGAYDKAAFAFSKLGRNLDDWLGTVISTSDVAIYGTLCALASMTRSAIKVNYHENDAFSFYLEQEPYTRELLDAFMNNQFKTVLDVLERSSNRHFLDVHLSRHVPVLMNEIKKRTLHLYFQPFTSVQLEKMGQAFGLSVTEMEKMAVELIQEGRIKARVDSTNKILRAKTTDPRTELYQRATKAATQTQKTTEKLLLRMKLEQANLIVKAPRLPERAGTGGPLQQSAFAADFYASGS